MRVLIQRQGKWTVADHTELSPDGQCVAQLMHENTMTFLVQCENMQIYSKNPHGYVVDVDLANPIAARVLTDDMPLPEQRRMVISGAVGGPSTIDMMDTVRLSREMSHATVAQIEYVYKTGDERHVVTFLVAVTTGECPSGRLPVIIPQLGNMHIYDFIMHDSLIAIVEDYMSYLMGGKHAELWSYGCRYYATYDEAMLPLLLNVVDDDTKMVIMSTDAIDI